MRRLLCGVATLIDTSDGFSLARAAKVTGLAVGLTLYAALASAATIIFPLLGAAFLLPLAIGIIAVAPPSKAVPRKLAISLLVVAAILLPLWPAYILLKFGSLPALTPPRLALYAVSALWAYDMTFSPWRRAQFVFAWRKSGAVTALFFTLFVLGVLSLPFSEGRSISIPEYVRQVIIWLVPFCAILTYCRRQRDFVLLIRVLTIAAVPVALIAIAEFASQELLANILSPFIADDAEWLRNAQALKIRDGAMRAQATHTHPLSLGEYLAFTAPFAAAFAVSAKTIVRRALWAGALLIIAAAAVSTDSRGAMIVIVVSLGAMSALLASRWLKRASASRWRPLAGLVFMLVVAATPIAAISAYGAVAGLGSISASNSTQSRLDQIEMAWPKIMKRPVGGYGTGRATRVLGYWGRMLTLDNYYLSLALDLGIPGPLTFLAMLGAWGATSFRRSMQSQTQLGVIYLACFASAASIAVGRTIISQTGNLAIIYFMMAAFAGASVTFSRRRSRNKI